MRLQVVISTAHAASFISPRRHPGAEVAPKSWLEVDVGFTTTTGPSTDGSVDLGIPASTLIQIRMIGTARGLSLGLDWEVGVRCFLANRLQADRKDPRGGRANDAEFEGKPPVDNGYGGMRRSRQESVKYTEAVGDSWTPAGTHGDPEGGGDVGTSSFAASSSVQKLDYSAWDTPGNNTFNGGWGSPEVPVLQHDQDDMPLALGNVNVVQDSGNTSQRARSPESKDDVKASKASSAAVEKSSYRHQHKEGWYKDLVPPVLPNVDNKAFYEHFVGVMVDSIRLQRAVTARKRKILVRNAWKARTKILDGVASSLEPGEVEETPEPPPVSAPPAPSVVMDESALAADLDYAEMTATLSTLRRALESCPERVHPQYTVNAVDLRRYIRDLKRWTEEIRGSLAQAAVYVSNVKHEGGARIESGSVQSTSLIEQPEHDMKDLSERLGRLEEMVDAMPDCEPDTSADFEAATSEIREAQMQRLDCIEKRITDAHFEVKTIDQLTPLLPGVLGDVLDDFAQAIREKKRDSIIILSTSMKAIFDEVGTQTQRIRDNVLGITTNE
ncbi:hypothetical protein FISHEDRAFT_71156 [Fistulina hepatica ATCC 64428]|nr:hypothetical protein FISHEDRAFT_71156 [Fistulina hepatica ATCC 64428]